MCNMLFHLLLVLDKSLVFMQVGSQLVRVENQGMRKILKSLMEVERRNGGMREAGIRNYGVSGIAFG